MIAVQELETRFRRTVADRKSPPSASPTNRASEIGHPCERYLVLSRTRGHERPPVSDELQVIFDVGDAYEQATKRDLTEMGLDVYGSGRSFPPNSYGITGHVDVLVARAPEWLDPERRKLGIEIKSLNPNDFGRVKRAEDLATFMKDHRWMRRWYAQAQTYMFLEDVELWLFVFRDKGTGWPEFRLCELDLEYVQGLLDRAERVNQHVKAGTLPGFHNDPSECRRCAFFGRSCDPQLVFSGPGVAVETDEGVLEAFDYYAQLAREVQSHLGPVKEFERVERQCKELAKLRAGEAAYLNPVCLVAGPVTATTKAVPVKGFEVKPRTDIRVTLEVSES